MKKIVVDKKGQAEGTGLGTILALIVGVVAVIIIIVGLTQGWGFIFDKLGFLPDDLNSAAVACASYAGKPSLSLSYCQYRELTIDGKKQWVNCNYIRTRIIAVLGADKAEYSEQDCDISPAAYCLNVLQEEEGYNGKSLINNFPCPIKP